MHVHMHVHMHVRVHVHTHTCGPPDALAALLPPLLRRVWGASSPPLLLTKSIAAAKRCGLKGHRPQIHVKLLGWVVYYLQVASLGWASDQAEPLGCRPLCMWLQPLE